MASKSIQHFAVSGTETVTFLRIPHLIYVTVPTGVTATIDFDGQAAAASETPMSLAVGTWEFKIPAATVTIVASGGSVTGVGVAL